MKLNDLSQLATVLSAGKSILASVGMGRLSREKESLLRKNLIRLEDKLINGLVELKLDEPSPAPVSKTGDTLQYTMKYINGEIPEIDLASIQKVVKIVDRKKDQIIIEGEYGVITTLLTQVQGWLVDGIPTVIANDILENTFEKVNHEPEAKTVKQTETIKATKLAKPKKKSLFRRVDKE